MYVLSPFSSSQIENLSPKNRLFLNIEPFLHNEAAEGTHERPGFGPYSRLVLSQRSSARRSESQPLLRTRQYSLPGSVIENGSVE